jgi:chitin synthase
MRYIAVTTKDPFRFTDDGFQLRVEESGKRIRVLITITMYNEECNELKGTLSGIARTSCTCRSSGVSARGSR